MQQDFFTPNNTLHTDTEQLKRQKTALKLNVQEICKDTQTGKINNYFVSLSECSCRDFAMRKKPCKHIYRLAHELGIFRLAGKTINDHSIKSAMDKKNQTKLVLDSVAKLCDNDKYILYKVMYEYLYHGKVPMAMDKTTIPKILFDYHLISKTDLNLESLANASNMDKLKMFIRSHDCHIKLRKKIDILKTLYSEYPDLFQLYILDFEFIVPSTEVLNSPRKIYSLVLPPQQEY